MSNIVIPDGGNIGSASDTDAISIASNGKPTFSQGIANSGTIDAGTIADAVTQPATDYIWGKVQTITANTSYEMINLSGTTNPYITWSGSIASFGDGGGSIVTGTTVHDLKFRTKGIYWIGFSLTMIGSNSETTRYIYAVIRGNGSASENGTELAYAMDNIPDTNSGSTDYGNCMCFYTGLFNANDQINFQVYNSATNADLHNSSHISVYKIKSVA